MFSRLNGLVAVATFGVAAVLAVATSVRPQLMQMSDAELSSAVAGCPGNEILEKDYCQHNAAECHQKWCTVLGTEVFPCGCVTANFDYGCTTEAGAKLGDAVEDGEKLKEIQCEARYDHGTCYHLGICVHGTATNSTCGTKQTSKPAC
jgi:hypothetical protein